jgi:hypothetical protein
MREDRSKVGKRMSFFFFLVKLRAENDSCFVEA